MLPPHHAAPPPNTVLIVDDEPLVRAAMAGQMRAVGFAVLEAENGEDAVTRYFEHQAEIIGLVLDLNMPGSRGEVALAIIRGVSPNLPVILATGAIPEVDVRHRPFGEPEVTVMLKPFEGSAIVRELQRLLEVT